MNNSKELGQRKFIIGDAVVHKANGPKMIVRSYEPIDGQEVTCEWFDRDQNFQSRSFHEDTLKKYEPPIIIAGPAKPSKHW